MSSFKALMVHRDEDKTIRHEMTELQHGDLPADGEVLGCGQIFNGQLQGWAVSVG